MQPAVRHGSELDRLLLRIALAGACGSRGEHTRVHGGDNKALAEAADTFRGLLNEGAA